METTVRHCKARRCRFNDAFGCRFKEVVMNELGDCECFEERKDGA